MPRLNTASSQPCRLATAPLVEGVGFEPTKAKPSDLQSDPFGRSGTPPGLASKKTRKCAYGSGWCQRRFAVCQSNSEMSPSLQFGNVPLRETGVLRLPNHHGTGANNSTRARRRRIRPGRGCAKSASAVRRPCQSNGPRCMVEAIDERLRQAFGAHVRCEGPLAASGAGLRIAGIDLRRPLGSGKVHALLDALGQYRIVTLAGQDLESFSVAHFERFANHWGAPLPHPSNFKRPALERFMDNPELLPYEERPSSRVDAAFPGETALPARRRVARCPGRRQHARTQRRGA